jgi:hypothetical protein
VRDIRNRCSHPDFNPNSAATNKALTSAAECLIPVVHAAIEAMVREPVEGTTGKTTAYRFFLSPFAINNDSFFSDYYLEYLFPGDELSAFPEEQVSTSFKTLAKHIGTVRRELFGADQEETLSKWLQPALFPVLGLKLQSGVKLVTGEHVFEPSFVLPVAGVLPELKLELNSKEAAQSLACLIYVLPYRSSLDAVATEPEFAGLTVVEMAHRALAASGVPWAVLTNGGQFRLLAKATAHKPRCFFEIDLEEVLDRAGDNEAALAYRFWLAMFSASAFTEKGQNDGTLLERVQIGSDRHGQAIGGELKRNVYTALEELGEGCLHFLRRNRDVLETWRMASAPHVPATGFLTSDELLTDIYQESLSLMYRLLFLFYAESRNLLPMEEEMYRESYSLESIRDDIRFHIDDPDTRRVFGRGTFDLWDRLTELWDLYINPVYNGGLFDPERHPLLETIRIDDYHLSRAVDLLSRTRPGHGQQDGAGRKKISYRDLDVRHLGSIYEGILEYTARIADDDLVVVIRGSGSSAYEEYAYASELSVAERQQLVVWEQAIAENPESPYLPRGCRIAGRKDKGSYFLVYGRRESKRKSSGSYYTPDYIVQYIVENALGPLIRGECRNTNTASKGQSPPSPRPLSSKEILELKILDPAMGSGHFLVAATEYLARAYGEALIREGEDTDGRMSEDEFTRYKRRVAERCIYGVDINSMAGSCPFCA